MCQYIKCVVHITDYNQMTARQIATVPKRNQRGQPGVYSPNVITGQPLNDEISQYSTACQQSSGSSSVPTVFSRQQAAMKNDIVLSQAFTELSVNSGGYAAPADSLPQKGK